MYKLMKRKAFTMIELILVIIIVAILSATLFPKAKNKVEESKRTGVDRNRNLLETIVRNEYEKPYFGTETEEETINRIYTNLSKNEDLKDMINPFIKNQKEVAFIKGNTITDKNKAGYVFTEEPNKDDLPKGAVYVVIKDETERTLPITSTSVSFNSYTSVIRNNGNIYIFGRNDYSQTGLGPASRLLYPTTFSILQDGINPLSLVISYKHSLAIGSDNNLYTWGDNQFGQLGTGDTTARPTPTLITLPNGIKPFSIQVGDYHSLIIGTDGNIYTWGYNYYGQLGTGNTTNISTPILINLPNEVKPISLSAGRVHSLAIGNDNNLYTWGRNEFGQLGIGDTISKSIPTLITLPNGVKPITIDGGDYHSMAIGTDENIYIWGRNEFGQLGTGDNTDRLTPTLIKLPNGIKPISISAGRIHSLAIGSDGNLYTWGSNEFGQLGTGDTTDRITPTLIKLPNEVKPISIQCGDGHSLAVGADGNIYTWGYNYYGQLGTGNINDTLTPTLITQFN